MATRGHHRAAGVVDLLTAAIAEHHGTAALRHRRRPHRSETAQAHAWSLDAAASAERWVVTRQDDAGSGTLTRMSPKSRGRKKRSGARKGRNPRHQPEPEPDLEEILEQIVRDAGADLVEIDDPLEAELLVSRVLGMWGGQHLIDTDPEVVFGETLVEIAQREGSPAAQALLRGLAAIGTDRQRTRAATAAAVLATRGVAEPSWADGVDPPTMTGCWAYSDVYGDQTSLLLGFERDGAPHALVVLVDQTLGGIAKDAFVIEGPDQVLDEIRRDGDELMVTLRQVPAAEARGIVEHAVATTDAVVDPPVLETYRPCRAIALARLRTLPPAVQPAEPAKISPTRRAGIVDEFLASGQAPDSSAQPPRGAALRCWWISDATTTVGSRCGSAR